MGKPLDNFEDGPTSRAPKPNLRSGPSSVEASEALLVASVLRAGGYAGLGVRLSEAWQFLKD